MCRFLCEYEILLLDVDSWNGYKKGLWVMCDSVQLEPQSTHISCFCTQALTCACLSWHPSFLWPSAASANMFCFCYVFLGFIIRHQQVFLSEIHLVRSQSLYSTAESFVVSESSSIPWHLIAFFKEKVPLMFTGKHTAYVWINRSRQYGPKTFQFAFSHVCFQKKYLTQIATSIKWKLRLEK